jgi:hypothetical protein
MLYQADIEPRDSGQKAYDRDKTAELNVSCRPTIHNSFTIQRRDTTIMAKCQRAYADPAISTSSPARSSARNRMPVRDPAAVALGRKGGLRAVRRDQTASEYSDEERTRSV